MICFYIKESSERNTIKLKAKSFFNKLEQKENLIELSIKENKKIGKRKVKRIVEKLQQNNVRLVALSNSLNKLETLKNTMYSNDINILDGRYLFKILSLEIIEYICKASKCDIQNIEFAVLVNDANKLNKNIILDLAEKVKTLTIITNNLKDFKDVENYLYNEKGIVIKISNNKKKGLLKSKIILNLDFCEEDINTYNIPKEDIIINTSYPVRIKTKKFNGININSYNIIIPNNYKIEGFDDEIIYESLIYNLDYNEARECILKDKIRIRNLIGEKGIIQEKEFGRSL